MKPETFVYVYIKSKLAEAGDFPSGPVVKTAHFQCKGHRFDPGPGTEIPRVWPESNINLNEENKFRRSRLDMSILKIGN